ncbi:Tol-Pal system beta propeller repeat protein TolB [Uliginosibacterium sp. sgz301328]|uniref:Tol-Pal system beta propeller repeat protein TolB n=1 Tax=Uliginosibacterium sp. sgz301328 TaxID=3243764 RepID=UPI00359E2D8E
MKRRNFLSLCSAIAVVGLSGMASLAHAQLSIEISGAGASRIPIAVGTFEGENLLPRTISDVVRDDLERSGLFRRVETGPQPIPEATIPDFANWKGRGADALAVGAVGQSGGRFEARFRLYDVARAQGLEGQSYAFQADSYRDVAHRIADAIYAKLIGEPGIFSTRIAYVEKRGQQFSLVVADADGARAVAVLRSGEPIISPTWSPDGTKLAYVSFEAKKPIIYVRDIGSERRIVLANFKGSNSAPAWSPDGRRLAIVLTKDGLSQLYMVNADGSGVRRISNSSGIDTEPTFSPDGQYIYFTSDRGGAPQIYRMSANGGDAQRVTFEGGYNVSPRVSPDGKTLAYISRNNGRFQLMTMDLATQQTQVMTDSSKDESPSFAPNGRYILYATEAGGRGVLSVVSVDGKTRYRLSQQASDVREPSWGPLAR